MDFEVAFEFKPQLWPGSGPEGAKACGDCVVEGAVALAAFATTLGRDVMEEQGFGRGEELPEAFASYVGGGVGEAADFINFNGDGTCGFGD